MLCIISSLELFEGGFIVYAGLRGSLTDELT